MRGKQVAARKKTLHSQKVEASCTVLEKEGLGANRDSRKE